MGPPESESLKIDTVSQNRLNAIKKSLYLTQILKKGFRDLGVTPGGYPLRQSFRSW